MFVYSFFVLVYFYPFYPFFYFSILSVKYYLFCWYLLFNVWIGWIIALQCCIKVLSQCVSGNTWRGLISSVVPSNFYSVHAVTVILVTIIVLFICLFAYQSMFSWPTPMSPVPVCGCQHLCMCCSSWRATSGSSGGNQLHHCSRSVAPSSGAWAEWCDSWIPGSVHANWRPGGRRGRHSRLRRYGWLARSSHYYNESIYMYRPRQLIFS